MNLFGLFVFLSVYMWLEDDFTFHLLSRLLLFIIVYTKLPDPQPSGDSPIFPLPSKHRNTGNLLEGWETGGSSGSHRTGKLQEHWETAGALGSHKSTGEPQEHRESQKH